MKRARRRIPSFSHNAAAKPRYRLADLLRQSPGGAPVDAAWDAIQPVGREIEPAAATLRAVRAMQRFVRQQQRRRAGRGVNLRCLIDDGRS